MVQILLKTLFDIIALIGHQSNVAVYVEKYGYNLGIIKGILLIIFKYAYLKKLIYYLD